MRTQHGCDLMEEACRNHGVPMSVVEDLMQLAHEHSCIPAAQLTATQRNADFRSIIANAARDQAGEVSDA